MDPCGSCGKPPPLNITTELPFYVVRAHPADRRPILVRLCIDCLERTIKGGAIVERDVIGRMSLRVYDEICRRLGREVARTL